VADFHEHCSTLWYNKSCKFLEQLSNYSYFKEDSCDEDEVTVPNISVQENNVL